MFDSESEHTSCTLGMLISKTNELTQQLRRVAKGNIVLKMASESEQGGLQQVMQMMVQMRAEDRKAERKREDRRLEREEKREQM